MNYRIKINLKYFGNDNKIMENIESFCCCDLDILYYDKKEKTIYISNIMDKNILTVKANEYQQNKFDNYELYVAKADADNFIKKNNTYFCDGSGYFHVTNSKVHGDKLIFGQEEVPKHI